MINYLHPETSSPVYGPMPVLCGNDLITGIYYNVLFPEERQNGERPALKNFLFCCLKGEAPEFLTPAKFDTLNTFGIKSTPRLVFLDRLSQYALDLVQQGKGVPEALADAQEKIKQNDVPRYREVIERMKQLRAKERVEDPAYCRFTLLIEALDECVADLDNILSRGRKLIEEEFKKGKEAGLLLLEKSKMREERRRTSDPESHLQRFENRLNAIEEAVNNVLDKTPRAAAFLAFQEATPDAVEEMKARWKGRNFTWISYNNITGEETRVKSKEECFGESTAFTSTIALSPELKVQRVALESLPSPSGSTRKILGVEVLNTQTNRLLALFTTHTDHLIMGTLYSETAQAIHRFVASFINQNPSLPVVLGGDLNAFETSGAAPFIEELRGGPFAGGQDYREGAAFYVSKMIADTTFVGREHDRFKARLTNEVFEANALDHILTQRVKVAAGVRDAVVYDGNGKLVDPHLQPNLFQERLILRKTASDHLLNAVIFHSALTCAI